MLQRRVPVKQEPITATDKTTPLGWKNHLSEFSFWTVAIASAIVLIGWFTGVRLVAHGALISVFVAALLPFLILAVIFVLPAVVTATLGLFGAIMIMCAPEVPVEIGGRAAWSARGVVPWYYRLLSRCKHPRLWSAPCGVVLGAAMLGALIAFCIVPGEARTAEVFARTQTAIDQAYKENGAFPRPTDDGHLAFAELGTNGDTQSQDVLLDGFGRPVRYEVRGRGKLASYRLLSYGFDGRPGTDDLCLSGATTLGRITSATFDALERLGALAGRSPATTRDKMKALQALKCADE